MNVRSTATPDSHSITATDAWLSPYLVVDSMLGTHQALVHIVTVNRYKNFADRMNHENLTPRKISHALF